MRHFSPGKVCAHPSLCTPPVNTSSPSGHMFVNGLWMGHFMQQDAFDVEGMKR